MNHLIPEVYLELEIERKQYQNSTHVEDYITIKRNNKELLYFLSEFTLRD